MKKPEHITNLPGTGMVSKDHPRIILRGMLDALHAKAALCEAVSLQYGRGVSAAGSHDIQDICRQLADAELSGSDAREIQFKLMAAEEVSKRAHAPKKYYGIDKLHADGGMGLVMAHLNVLRTEVRDVERFAAGQFAERRPDIIEMLNRLSDYVYVLMLKLHVERKLDS